MKTMGWKLVLVLLAAAIAISPLMGRHSDAASVALTDIESHWAKDSIQGAIHKGYVDGYPDGTFQPDLPISKAEFATMLTKAQSYVRQGEPGITEWYSEFAGAVKREGIYKEADFAASTWMEPLSRLEMARFAYRAVDRKLKADAGGLDDLALMFHAVRVGLIQGVAGGELAKEGTTTRAQAVTIIERIGKVLAGEALEVDKNALSYAEIEMTGTNLNTAFGMTLEKPLPRELELNDDVTARIEQIVVMSYTDMDSPFRKYFPAVMDTYRTQEEEQDLFLLAVKITFLNPTYMNRPAQVFNPRRYLSLGGFSSVFYPINLSDPEKYNSYILNFDLSEKPEVTTWMIDSKPRHEIKQWLSSPYTTRLVLYRVNSGISYIIASKN